MPDYTNREDPLFGMSQRRQPDNIVAEQALLGALMANNSAYDRISEFLLPEHFADPIHGRIFKAIGNRIEQGLLADAVTLKSDLDNSGALSEVGGTAYLAQLLTAMVGIINAIEYGKVIYNSWLRRGLIKVGTDVVNDAYSPDDEDLDATKLVERAELALFNLTSGNSTDHGSVSIKDAVKKALEEAARANRGDGVQAISTGFRSLDDRMLGLLPPQLIIIAGRPGMGKTTLARNIAFSVACESVTVDGVSIDGGLPVAFFAAEGSAEDIGRAGISQIASVPVGKIIRGTFDNDEASRMVKAQKWFDNAKLEVFDEPHLSVRKIASRARRLQRKFGNIGLIVVDYLQRLPDPPGVKDKRLAVGENCKDLVELAKELSCPVILLSQLSRSVEQRADKRPMMSDLRETGEIEDTADVIMMLYREEYYHRQTAPVPGDGPSAQADWDAKLDRCKGKADVMLPKVRRDEAGMIELIFNGAASRFEDGERR